ncbi:MAG: DUF721 domain-containing protein, partial [Brachybacterium sp.]|nr:DUF721 domain-containing protein [Brachybacterium sp.]
MSSAPRRPRLANPYDLSTWKTAPGGEPQEGRDSSAPSTIRAGDPQSVPEPAAQPGPEPEQELFDPPELPAPPDPFELARRTVNRSRAAARDRGLFPISAKTQARDVRDRSGKAPGYSGS